MGPTRCFFRKKVYPSTSARWHLLRSGGAINFIAGFIAGAQCGNVPRKRGQMWSQPSGAGAGAGAGAGSARWRYHCISKTAETTVFAKANQKFIQQERSRYSRISSVRRRVSRRVASRAEDLRLTLSGQVRPGCQTWEVRATPQVQTRRMGGLTLKMKNLIDTWRKTGIPIS